MKDIKSDKQLLRYCRMSLKEFEDRISNYTTVLYEYVQDYYSDLVSENIERVASIPFSIILFTFALFVASIKNHEDQSFDYGKLLKALRKHEKDVDEWKYSQFTELFKLCEIYKDSARRNNNDFDNMKLTRAEKQIEEEVIEKLKLTELSEYIDLDITLLMAAEIMKYMLITKTKKEIEKGNFNINKYIKLLAELGATFDATVDHKQITSDIAIEAIDATIKLSDCREKLEHYGIVLKTAKDGYLTTIKEFSHAIENYKYFINLFSSGEIDELTSVEEVSKHEQMVDSYVIEYTYDRINNNIVNKYVKQRDENEVLSAETELSEIEKMLISRHIPLKSVSLNKRQLLNKKTKAVILGKLLDILFKAGFDYNELFNTELFYILIDTSDNEISNVVTLINTGIVDYNFIKEMPGIFLTNKSDNNPFEPVLPQVMKNVKTLKRLGFDFNNINYSPYILLKEEQEIISSYEMINKYKLTEDIKCYLICNIDKISCLDLMLENNIPLYLVVPIGNSYNYLLTLKKIIICQNLSIPYLNKKGLLLPYITEENSFLVPDEKINEYIENDNEVLVEESKESTTISIDALDEYYNPDTQCYHIGNIQISKNKFIRMLSNNHDLLTSLVNNSFLSKDMIEELKVFVNREEIKKLFRIE